MNENCCRYLGDNAGYRRGPGKSTRCETSYATMMIRQPDTPWYCWWRYPTPVHGKISHDLQCSIGFVLFAFPISQLTQLMPGIYMCVCIFVYYTEIPSPWVLPFQWISSWDWDTTAKVHLWLHRWIFLIPTRQRLSRRRCILSRWCFLFPRICDRSLEGRVWRLIVPFMITLCTYTAFIYWES